MSTDSVPKPPEAKFSTLILEDDPVCAKVLSGLVQREGGEVVVCSTIAEAQAKVAAGHFDLFLLDHQLPDGKGSSFFYELRSKGHLSPAIMLTAFPEIPVAVELTRDGLFDYLTKPFEPDDITARFRQAIQRLNQPEAVWGQWSLSGRSSGIRNVQRLIQQAAANPLAAVLLNGETGTGKDLTARVIHETTFQNTNPVPPFVSLSCPTLPADMFEAELFGAERGSYTGAYQQRMGMVAAAEGGTLFLDEIAEVPLLLQPKLLQFLETRSYRRLGSTESQEFSGRIVAATNRNLQEEVSKGRFREDLMYRLDVFTITLPPLREHLEDLAELIDLLSEQLARKYQRKKLSIKPKDMPVLETYDFPGNVRELRNLLERSLLQTPAEDPWLQIDPVWLAQARARGTRPLAPSAAGLQRSLSPIDAQEYELIRKALEAEKGVIRRAAAKLGMSHQALLRRLEKWPELRQGSGTE